MALIPMLGIIFDDDIFSIYDSIFNEEKIEPFQKRLDVLWNNYEIKQRGFKYRISTKYYPYALAFTKLYGRTLYFDTRLNELSDSALLFMIFHEMGHHYRGPDQLTASCWAIEEMEERAVSLDGVPEASHFYAMQYPEASRDKLSIYEELKFSNCWPK